MILFNAIYRPLRPSLLRRLETSSKTTMKMGSFKHSWWKRFSIASSFDIPERRLFTDSQCDTSSLRRTSDSSVLLKHARKDISSAQAFAISIAFAETSSPKVRRVDDCRPLYGAILSCIRLATSLSRGRLGSDEISLVIYNESTFHVS